tara:strand:+ start:1281 stop:2729 length:1449 start_codon:yes stop_codon:yes gene_type:complete
MIDFKEYIFYNIEKPLIFNSGLFLFLFFGFLSVFILLRKQRIARAVWTILFSLFFYYKSSGFYFWILIVSTLVDYTLGIYIYNAKKTKRLLYLIISLVSNLGILIYFKYTNFFIDIINGFGANYKSLDIFLPVGISFYTFQTLSYSIDIYRGKLSPEKNILNFAFFVTFFPQLVAGPIVRASEFLPQIRLKLKLSNQNLSKGVFLIGSGLFKKAVISDYISVNYVDRIFDNPLLYSGVENLIGVYAYALQIYCDFSGYSDIAIGLALLLGFYLPINFDSPYQSSSVTEFWRRWHISLSSWLKDYLYISLGGNRKGIIRTYFNLSITMILGGLWHGANWKFVFWGIMHGLMLVVEKIIRSFFRIPKNIIFKILGVLITFHFVTFCWIFFRAESFSVASDILFQIKNNFNFINYQKVISSYPYVILMIIIGYALHMLPRKFELDLIKIIEKSPLFIKAFFLALICWTIVQVSGTDVVPFIYFQF